MTSWLRGLRATGLLVVVLGAGAGAAVTPYGVVSAYGAESAPSRTASPSASPSGAPSGSPSGAPSASGSASAEPSRAGSRAGEGRERPGRPEAVPEEEEEQEAEAEAEEDALDTDEGDSGDVSEEDDVTAVPEPSREAAEVPSAPPQQPVRQNVAHTTAGPTESALRILPLGGGLILVGLGLGLAFVGLRLRRG